LNEPKKDSRLGFQNKFNILLNNINCFNNKHIPLIYKTSNRKQRLQLLAGLIDSDGYKEFNGYQITTKFSQLRDDILYLCRSLGYGAYSFTKKIKDKSYYYIHISGDTSEVPVKLEYKKNNKRKQKKSVLMTGIKKINKLEKDDYYGFSLDGDSLYLMGDFTVTHNTGKTRVALELIFQKGVNTLYVTPSLGIKDQTVKIFEGIFGKKNVGTHKDKKAKPITICNYQGLKNKSSEFFDNFQMLIIDESHHSSCKTITDLNMKCWNHIYYRYYFSATPYRNDGSDLELKGTIGDIIYTYDACKAIEDGYLVPPYFFIYKFKHPGKHYDNYAVRSKEVEPGVFEKIPGEYEGCIINNDERNDFIIDICKTIKEKDNSQILVLLERVEQGEILHKMIPDSHWIHGGTKGNNKTIEKFNNGEIRLLIASTVVGEGIDLPKVKVLVLAGIGKARSMVYQKIGRVLRISPGKNKAVIVDFFDENTRWLEKHGKQRIKYYKTYKTSKNPDHIKIIE